MRWGQGSDMVRSRWLLLAAALLAALLAARLGFWQLNRADQKLALQAQMHSRSALPPLVQAALARSAELAKPQHYQRVLLQGRWLPQHTVYLDNRQMNGKPGFFVLTPLLLAEGDAVLVQRGWMPRNFVDRSALQPLPTPQAEVQLLGRLAPPPSKLFSLGGADAGRIRQNLDLSIYAQDIGLSLRPLSVQQLAPARPATAASDTQAQSVVPLLDDGLLRQWPEVAADVSKHHAYAVQWFALCALITGLYVWFQILRPRHV